MEADKEDPRGGKPKGMTLLGRAPKATVITTVNRGLKPTNKLPRREEFTNEPKNHLVSESQVVTGPSNVNNAAVAGGLGLDPKELAVRVCCQQKNYM